MVQTLEADQITPPQTTVFSILYDRKAHGGKPDKGITNMSPTSEVAILSQLIDDENGHYRLRVKRQVHYLTISSNSFDEDTMCRPYLLIPKLPEFPATQWTTMNISRDENGSLTSTISTDPLRGINQAWHDTFIDVLSLERTKRYNSGVHEVQYDGAPAVAKIACFEWDIARIEHETWVYSILSSYRCQHPNESSFFPEFLGHLTENDRVIGFLMQKIDGEPAGIDDLADCKAALQKLHSLDLIHGDVNRYNFLFNRASSSGAYLVDFEHVRLFDEDLAREELLSLPSELVEETGRGTTVVLG